MWSCPSDEPCHALRAGACLLTWCLYIAMWPYAFFDESFEAVLGRLAAGDIVNGSGLWAGVVLVGLGSLWQGIRAARSHDDPVDSRSLAWSLGVIALGLMALDNGWYLGDEGFEFHVSRAFWLAWIASNAANLWLQLRGVIGRRGNSRAGRSARQGWPFGLRRRAPRRRFLTNEQDVGRRRPVSGRSTSNRNALAHGSAPTRRGEGQWRQ